MKTKYDAIALLLNSSRGTTIPKTFYEDFDLEKWGIDQAKYNALESEDNDFYWDTWQSVLDKAKYTDNNGNVYTLWQDGDLWAICPELMTNEEYENFFGEERE